MSLTYLLWILRPSLRTCTHALFSAPATKSLKRPTRHEKSRQKNKATPRDSLLETAAVVRFFGHFVARFPSKSQPLSLLSLSSLSSLSPLSLLSLLPLSSLSPPLSLPAAQSRAKRPFINILQESFLISLGAFRRTAETEIHTHSLADINMPGKPSQVTQECAAENLGQFRVCILCATHTLIVRPVECVMA